METPKNPHRVTALASELEINKRRGNRPLNVAETFDQKPKEANAPTIGHHPSENDSAILSHADPADRADVAFLFEENDGSRRAITKDAMGAKLPEASKGWSVTQTFLLAVDHIMPVDLEPEPVIRAIFADGFYCWDDQLIAQPKSTGQ